MPNRIRIEMGLTGLAQVTTGLKAVTGGLKSLAGPLIALAGASISLGAFAKGMKGILALGDRLGDTSARTGVAIGRMLKLEQAFADTGAGAESAATFINKLQKQIEEAVSTGAGASKFANLGLSLSALVEMDPAEQLERTFAAIAALPAPSQRAAAAMELFGRAGGEILPLVQDGGALALAEKRLGRLGEILERNAARMGRYNDALEASHIKTDQFFAGVVDSMGGVGDDMVSWFDTLDLTGLGQKVGAYLRLGIDAGKDGTLSDFISLSIQAGFELGTIGAKKIMATFIDGLSNGDIWKGVWLGFFTTFASAMKAIGELVLMLYRPANTVAIYIGDALKFAFSEAVRFFGLDLEKVINGFIIASNALFKTNFLPVFLGPDSQFGPPDLGKAWEKAGTVLQDLNAQFWNERIQGLREFLGFAGTIRTGMTPALDELKARIAALIQSTEEAAAAAKKEKDAVKDVIPVRTKHVSILDLEIEAKRQLADIDMRRAKLDGDYGQTLAQKFPQRIALLHEEKQVLADTVKLLRDKADLEQDPAARDALRQKAEQFAGQESGVDRQLVGQGPDPNSTPEQMKAAITELQDQFGTVAQSIARQFKNVIGTAVSSVSNGLQKLIGDTEFWSSRLGEIAGPIMGSVTSAISTMFTEWIVGRALAAAKNIFFAEAEGTAETTAKAPGALLTSISSWGVAAAVGVAALVAAMAAIGGGFKGGGYTGNGGTSAVAGSVHGREYVFDAPATAAWTPELLDSMRRGDIKPSDMSAGGGGNTVNIAAFNTKFEAHRWASTQEEETWFVDLAKRTSHRLRT